MLPTLEERSNIMILIKLNEFSGVVRTTFYLTLMRAYHIVHILTQHLIMQPRGFDVFEIYFHRA